MDGTAVSQDFDAMAPGEVPPPLIQSFLDPKPSFGTENSCGAVPGDHVRGEMDDGDT